MRMLGTNQSRITRPLSIESIPARVNVSRNTFFSSHSEKKNIFFGVDIVVKNKLICDLPWSVLLSRTTTRHYSFPKHFFVLFLHGKQVCKRL